MASERINEILTAEARADGSSGQRALPSRQNPWPANDGLDDQSEVLDEIKKALQAADGGVTDIESVLAGTTLSNDQVVKHFGSMHAVVIALVESLAVEMSTPLKAPANTPLREILLQFGQRITAEDCRWQLRGLYRIALTESIRNRETGEDFYHRGPGLLTAELAGLIKRYQAMGAVRAEDSYLLASQFMALVRMNLDDGDDVRTAVHSDVAKTVDMFCSGIQAGATPCAN
jgi:hypothetical protein